MHSVWWLFCAATLVVLSANVGSAQVIRQTGLRFLDDSTYRSIPLASTPLLGTIPSVVDLSSRFPEPGDQGQQASCVGWAVAYALKTYQEGVERNWPLIAPQHIYSPSFIYNQIKSSPGCDGGTTFVDALNLLRRDGVASMTDFPYLESECSKKPDPQTLQKAREFAIADWRRVNVQDDTEVKTQLSAGFPVMIGMKVDAQFMQLKSDVPYSDYSGNSLGGHAMVLVGYDDSKNAYKVINSWGKLWGASGYGWISYSAFRDTVMEGYIAQDIVLVPPPTTVPPPAIKRKPAGAEIKDPTYTANVLVQSPSGAEPGMKIFIPATISNAAGEPTQIVIKFNYLNGPPLLANPQENTFRGVGGVVSVGTPVRTIGSDSEALGKEPITIPYSAMNLPPSGGLRTYNLAFTAFLYVGNIVAAQSYPVPFIIAW